MTDRHIEAGGHSITKYDTSNDADRSQFGTDNLFVPVTLLSCTVITSEKPQKTTSVQMLIVVSISSSDRKIT